MQSNTYLNYEGIKGETTAEQFKDMITLLSMDWAIDRVVTAHTGTAMDREASAARIIRPNWCTARKC